MLNFATEDCTNWLGESLQAFKHRALESFADHKYLSVADSEARSLLDAVCIGDLVQAETLLKSLAEPSEAGQLWSLGPMLQVISQLEQDWHSDRRGYADTVFAFWNVRRLLNRLDSNKAVSIRPLAPVGGRILLAASPGTEHIIGLSVVDDSFRLAGWTTQIFTSGDRDSILESAKTAAADVIGLSVGHDKGLIELENFISVLRSRSRNRLVKIILGGNIFSDPIRQYDWLGADYIALSVESALEYCSGIASTGLQRN